MDRVMPPDGYSRGLTEPAPRSVQETSDAGLETGLIVLGAGEFRGKRYCNLLGGGIEPGETLEDWRPACGPRPSTGGAD